MSEHVRIRREVFRARDGEQPRGMSEHAHTRREIFRARHLQQRWKCSSTTLWRMVQRGDLPKPIRIAPGISGWWNDVIEAFEATREGASTEAA